MELRITHFKASLGHLAGCCVLFYPCGQTSERQLAFFPLRDGMSTLMWQKVVHGSIPYQPFGYARASRKN